MMSGVPYAEVIGDPISHSKSPLIHRFWLEKLGLQGDYRATRVKPSHLSRHLASRRRDPAWRGCNLTIPHKVAAIAIADEVHSSAQAVGAANCVVTRDGRLLAFNTDLDGVGAAITLGHSSACIIGAGGAARALFPVLDVFCAHDVRILVRDPDKAKRALGAVPLPLRFYPMTDAAEAMRDVEGIINASPLGMTGQPSIPGVVLDAMSQAAPGAYVFDMVYAPVDTALLKRAQELGMEAVDGLTMLVGQAARAFHLFFGHPAPREHDAELRKLLTA